MKELDNTWGKDVPGKGTVSADVLRQRVTGMCEEQPGGQRGPCSEREAMVRHAEIWPGRGSWGYKAAAVKKR